MENESYLETVLFPDDLFAKQRYWMQITEPSFLFKVTSASKPGLEKTYLAVFNMIHT